MSFLISLTIFILRHNQDSEFVILWTSGVKKDGFGKFIFFSSIIILILYLIFSTFLTPYALNKSRLSLVRIILILSYQPLKHNSLVTLLKVLLFGRKKFNNEIKNIFLHDKGNNLKNLSSNISETKEIVVVAENGIIDEKKLFLFNGQIVSQKKK